MTSRPKILQWLSIGLFIITIAITILIVFFDWNRARPWINEKVSHSLGRHFAINGDLSVHWERPEGKWLPWPRISAYGVEIGNPAWMRPDSRMVEAKRVAFTVSPFELFEHRVFIPILELEQPSVSLVRERSGRSNWTFPSAPNDKSLWKVDVASLAIDRGTVGLNDAEKKASVRIDVESLPSTGQKQDYSIRWKMSGHFNGEPLSGIGKSGDILSLRNPNQVFPLKADLKIGKTSIDAEGNINNPSQAAGLDLTLKLASISMAKLYPLTGMVLPETPPFSTEGHLSGKIATGEGEWHYENFEGKVGDSDLSGSVRYLARQPRPLVTGEVKSSLLRFQDLAPLIGADSNKLKVERGATVMQPKNKVFPVEPFRTERWQSIDADVKFSGTKIVRKEGLPIDDLTAHLTLKDGVLSLSPLNFGVAGGNLESNINLDGRNGPIKADMKIAARRLKLNQLFPKIQQMQASLGEVNADAILNGKGDSVSTLLASANGEMKAIIDRGTMSKLLLEEMGLNLGNIIVTKLFGDKQIQLNCLATDFKINKGLMTARTFVMDTEEATLYVDGRISLAQEQLDLILRPETKDVRLVSLRSPLYVSGTFKNPSVDVDKGVLVAKTGGAIVLGTVAPAVAAFLPLINPGTAKGNECGKFFSRVKNKPLESPNMAGEDKKEPVTESSGF